MSVYRQGDLMLRRVGDAKKGKTSTVTLAVGEESGHSHVVEAKLLRAMTEAPGLVSIPDTTELRVAGMPWRHEAIELPPGQYEFWVQRELTEDQEMEEVRRVQD